MSGTGALSAPRWPRAKPLELTTPDPRFDPAQPLTVEGRGRLTLVRRGGGRDKNGRTTSLWRCDCGVEKEIMDCRVKRGLVTSCGCSNSRGNRKHGGHGSATYQSWKALKNRCLNESSAKFKDYGGRGISVCPEWAASFETFVCDMGPRPRGTTIDRIDNAKGYEPGNCRWASPKQQARNSRRNRYIEANGRRQLLTEWESELGVRHGVISKRLSRGWSEQDAVTKPFQPSSFVSANHSAGDGNMVEDDDIGGGVDG